MNSSPKVSICIPTYNYGHFIGQAIDSILKQDFSDYEVIILDNDSRDNTENVVNRYSDQRLKYIKNPSNIGFIANINKGLELSSGEYIIYLCADDIWFEGIMKKEVSILDSHKNVTLVHTAEKRINSQGNVIEINKGSWENITPGPKAFKDFFRLSWNFSFSSCMIRRPILKKVGGFNPEFGNIADSGVFLRMCLEGDIAFIDESLVKYRIHNETLTKELLAGAKIFYDQKRLIDRAFDWKETKEKNLQYYKYKAFAYLARDIIKLSHLIRIEAGVKSVLKGLKVAFTVSPIIVFSPALWIKLPASLILPRWIIRRLREIKRRRYLTNNKPVGR